MWLITIAYGSLYSDVNNLPCNPSIWFKIDSKFVHTHGLWPASKDSLHLVEEVKGFANSLDLQSHIIIYLKVLTAYNIIQLHTTDRNKINLLSNPYSLAKWLLIELRAY